jgi:hypothetical protein
MAGQAEATRVAGIGEDRELRKQNGSRNQSRNNDLMEKATFPFKLRSLPEWPCASSGQILSVSICIDDVSQKQYKQVYIIGLLAERITMNGEMARAFYGDRLK